MTVAVKRQNADASSQCEKKRARRTKERKVATSLGITVTFRARKYLNDEELQAALDEVMVQLREAA